MAYYQSGKYESTYEYLLSDLYSVDSPVSSSILAREQLEQSLRIAEQTATDDTSRESQVGWLRIAVECALNHPQIQRQSDILIKVELGLEAVGSTFCVNLIHFAQDPTALAVRDTIVSQSEDSCIVDPDSGHVSLGVGGQKRFVRLVLY